MYSNCIKHLKNLILNFGYFFSQKTRGANLTQQQIVAAKKLIGQCIYKELDGDRIHGIVTHFLSRMNLLKV